MKGKEKPLKIYNASAGSGKTYTLVQAYLNIVLNSKDPLKFRSILAMTFTNKAANEMKERILSALIDLSEDKKSEKQIDFLNNTSENNILSKELIEFRSREILNKILHNYSGFSVMTIDKFTHKIIRTFAKDLGLSIDFNVEMDIKNFRKNVTDLLIDQIGRNSKLTKLLLRYANDNLDEEKSWNFSKQIYDFSDLLFKEDAISPINSLKEVSDEDFANIKADLIKDNKIISEKLNRNSTEIIDIIERKGLIIDDFLGKTSSILAFFKKIQAGNMVSPTATILKQVDSGRLAKEKTVNEQTVIGITDIIQQYFNQINQVITHEVPQFKLNKKILNNLNNLTLLKYLIEFIDKVKEDENILLLSDFYKEIADIITKEPVPFIYERLGIRYQHFLLDEFQDTSQLQWINLIPLVHNSLSQSHENLIVGDGKQAIYRWRNGEVEQFTKLPESIHNPNEVVSLNEANNLFKEMGEKVQLDSNYRSSKEVVEFNNAFFEVINQTIEGHLKYIYDDHKQNVIQKTSGFVEMAFDEEFSEDEAQLKYILDCVNLSISKGYSLKDICIISKTNKKGALIADFLNQKGFDIISAESLFIGKDKTVKFLASLMQSYGNSNDKNSKIKTIEHYCALNDLLTTEILIDKRALSEIYHIKDFFIQKDIALKSPEDFHNLYDFIEHLIEAFNLNPSLNPYLQFFMEEIHLFELNKNSNIREFNFWFKEKGQIKSIVSPEGANAIRIMTIHKSKGLEFPIVICPFFDWKLEPHKQTNWIHQPTKKLPAYFISMAKELAETELSDVFNEELAKFNLDQLNMLYVAFTRPEIALFVSGKPKLGIFKTLIKPTLEKIEFLNENESKYSFGQFEYNSKKEEINNDKNIAIDFVKQIMNKPQLSYKSAIEWDINELDQKKNFGTLIHLVLSQLNNYEDLEKELNLIAIKKGLKEEDIIITKKYIEELFNDLKFNDYFISDSWNEKSLIDKKGILFIPDKILKLDNELKVVDFKTGKFSPGHEKQVSNYIKILKDMGYENVSGEIFYTENLEFKSVS